MMRGLPKPISPNAGKTNPLKHMADGLHFIFQRQTILVLVSLIAVSAFLSMPYNTLLPVFASDVLKQSALAGGGCHMWLKKIAYRVPRLPKLSRSGCYIP